jgi:leader peptidase (prepilin peptidase) / N-methyltransferase
VTSAVDAAVAVFFCGVVLLLAVLDLRRRTIPNRIVLPSAAIVLAARTAVHPSPVWIAAGAGAAAFLLIAAAGRPGSMGMGDVKLALLLGVAVGESVGIALFVALGAAALVGIVLMLRHGFGARFATLPFAPFLAAGGIVALVAGGPLG